RGEVHGDSRSRRQPERSLINRVCRLSSKRHRRLLNRSCFHIGGTMTEHIVTQFDEDLKNLSELIAEMGGLAEKLVGESISALLRRDLGSAQRIIATDRTIDRLQAQIEEKAVLTLAKRQPVANDLREVIAALRISNDLERIGDLAKNIAKRIIALEGQLQSH